MSNVSIGPAPEKEQPGQNSVDAQAQTEDDIDHGLAGVEAKPFARPARSDGEHSRVSAPGDDENPASKKPRESLVSGRRNPGRD